MEGSYQLESAGASPDDTRTMSAATGADVESICTKCGDVWHVVVAKVGDKIAKVQCKQCHGFHRYKPPPGKEPLRPLKAAAAAPKAPRAPSAKGKKKPAAPEPPAVAADLSKPVRKYSPMESYTPGERVSHTTFGAGVVEGSPGTGKVQVAFPGGRRILASAKAAPTLGKPTNTPDR
jgi:hypothetical protein